MEEIVTTVASKAAEPLLAWVRRQCGYVIFTNSYVGQLEDELEKLNNARARVQHSVDEALNDMKRIEGDVTNWVRDAETVANKARDVLAHKARDVLDDEGRAKKTCFYGWRLNPKARYCLGRDARKTAQAIQPLIPQSKFEGVYYECPPPGLVGGAPDVNLSACDGGDTIQELTAGSQFDRVDFENPPPGLVGGAPAMSLSAGDVGDTITDSRASIFRDIMKALDDEKQKVIGVYGPGGVGKTTLLEEVEKKLRKERRPFHMIVKAKVSQTPDLNKIQDDIAYFFGLKLKDELSEVGRRDLLCQRLQKDPSDKILIILDDLWHKLDLKAVGIPLGDESKGCKLLLTSRFSDVLEKEMGADRTFRLEGLNDGEAFKLFEKTVGDKLKDEELRRIAPEVVKKLAGLPLLIISVASTLKYSHECAWNKALRKIDESDIKTIVKLSYDHLNSEDAKSLFLLCGLIGGTIRVETLFVLGMGLGLFEECNETMQDSRDELNIALHRLRSICLLQDGGDDKENVTIHDLYSEVVVSTPFRDQNSLMMNNNYGFLSKEKLEKCWAICLADVDKKRLDELMKCRLPDLKILMLSQPERWHRMQEHEHEVGDCSGLIDFTNMRELCALYFHSMDIAKLPLSIEILGNLHSLYLDNCDVEDVAILGKLKALQILSFVWSTISRLPKEIGELTNLRLLNLSNCYRLKTIEPGGLEGLIKLEELHMKSSFDQWMGLNEIPSESCNARLAELKSLTRLTTLEISIPDPTMLLENGDLPFGNLIRFWINIGNVDQRKFQGLKTMNLKLKGCDGILSKDWVQENLQKTQYLCLDGLGGFKKNAHELCVRGFTWLKHLKILNSPSIKYIASSSGDLPIAFTMLESLFLENLINLENLCNGPIALDCFSKLKDISIRKCHRLENLWFQSKMQRLVHLEEIQICECDSLQAIITYDAGKVEATADDIVELPNVRRLELRELSNMTSFCTGAKGAPIQVSLPSLQELLLKSVGSLKRIWRGVLPKSSFDKLANLTFSRSSDQLDVFPSTIIGRLHNLKSVRVFECPSLESLFDFGSLDSYMEQTIVSLPKLKEVMVKSCPSLESLFDFGSLDSYMEQTIVLLPILKEVMVKSCPSLESLFSCGSLDSNMEHKIVLLPKLKKVVVSEAGWLRHIVLSDSHTVFGFPSLKNVIVDNCSELRYLFPYYTATTLDKLKRLAIINCKQMKEVVPKEEGGRSKAKVMRFPSLIILFIWWCPNLGAFIRSPTSAGRQLGKMIEENDELAQPLFNDMVTFPNMIVLGIKGVQCKELWNDQIPDDSFCNLKTLKLKGCDNLQRIAPSHMWKRLQCCLKNLEVKSCHSIKIIYESDGTVVESGNLMVLVLCGLDNLRHIWRYDSLPNIPFPRLRYVKVTRCSRLEMLFATSTVKFLKQIQVLEVGSCEDMELIVGHKESEEVTGTTITFSKLDTLRLWNLPKFKSFLPENYSMKFPYLDMYDTESDQGSQSEDESDGESQDESDWDESDDKSDWDESDDESDGDKRDGEIESSDLHESSESVSEEESEDEEVMGKLRTQVMGK